MQDNTQFYNYGAFVAREGKVSGKGGYLTVDGKWEEKNHPKRAVFHGYLKKGKLMVQPTVEEICPQEGRWVRLKTPKSVLKNALRAMTQSKVAVEGLLSLGRPGVLAFLRNAKLPQDSHPDVFTRFCRLVRTTGDFEEGADIIWTWVSTGNFPRVFSKKYLVSSNHTYPTEVIAGWVYHMLQETK